MISIRSRSHYADQTPKPTELPHNGNLFSSRIFPGLSVRSSSLKSEGQPGTFGTEENSVWRILNGFDLL